MGKAAENRVGRALSSFLWDVSGLDMEGLVFRSKKEVMARCKFGSHQHETDAEFHWRQETGGDHLDGSWTSSENWSRSVSTVRVWRTQQRRLRREVVGRELNPKTAVLQKPSGEEGRRGAGIWPGTMRMASATVVQRQEGGGLSGGASQGTKGKRSWQGE